MALKAILAQLGDGPEEGSIYSRLRQLMREIAAFSQAAASLNPPDWLQFRGCECTSAMATGVPAPAKPGCAHWLCVVVSILLETPKVGSGTWRRALKHRSHGRLQG